MWKTIAFLIVILLLVFYFLYSKESFAPYASILVPKIVNSSAGFDYPNQFGETTNPYEAVHVQTANDAFNEMHYIYINDI